MAKVLEDIVAICAETVVQYRELSTFKTVNDLLVVIINSLVSSVLDRVDDLMAYNAAKRVTGHLLDEYD